MDKFLNLFLSIFLFLAFPASSFAATLSLSPSSGTLNKGCNYSVDINLDTGGLNTDGTDAIVKYDPSKITVNSVSPGTIYPDYPTANPNSSTGTITISGLASVSTPVSGSGKFATINLNINSASTTSTTTGLNFVFDPNNPTDTTDSNIVQTGTVVDILSSVTNGNYTIGGGSCSGGAGTTTPQGTTGVTQATPSGQTIDVITGGTPGAVENTIILAVTGGILAVLGILGLALL